MGYDGTGTALGDAAVVANRLSEAYFRAAKRARVSRRMAQLSRLTQGRPLAAPWKAGSM